MGVYSELRGFALAHRGGGELHGGAGLSVTRRSMMTFCPSTRSAFRRASARAVAGTGRLDTKPIRHILACCASDGRDLKKRPPTKALTNVRRFSMPFRTLAALSRRDGAGRPAGRPYTGAAGVWLCFYDGSQPRSPSR